LTSYHVSMNEFTPVTLQSLKLSNFNHPYFQDFHFIVRCTFISITWFLSLNYILLILAIKRLKRWILSYFLSLFSPFSTPLFFGYIISCL
jgi:hypothetical protein